MKKALVGTIVALVVIGTACGSGSGGGGTVQSGLSASFTADRPSPPSGSVAAVEGAATNDMVTVDITVTNVADVYSAVFRLDYDSTRATYVGHSPGTLLEQGGHTPDYEVQENVAGTLVISASRQGAVGGVNASGTVPVIRLTFRVDQVGNSIVTYAANSLLDDQLQPQPIPGITWFGGSIDGI